MYQNCIPCTITRENYNPNLRTTNAEDGKKDFAYSYFVHMIFEFTPCTFL